MKSIFFVPMTDMMRQFAFGWNLADRLPEGAEHQCFRNDHEGMVIITDSQHEEHFLRELTKAGYERCIVYTANQVMQLELA